MFKAVSLLSLSLYSFSALANSWACVEPGDYENRGEIEALANREEFMKRVEESDCAFGLSIAVGDDYDSNSIIHVYKGLKILRVYVEKDSSRTNASTVRISVQGAKKISTHVYVLTSTDAARLKTILVSENGGLIHNTGLTAVSKSGTFKIYPIVQ